MYNGNRLHARGQAATTKEISQEDVKEVMRLYDRTARMCGYGGKLWVENDLENAEIIVNVQIMSMALTSWGLSLSSDSVVLPHVCIF